MHYPDRIEYKLNKYTDNSHSDIDEYLNKLNIKKDEDKDNE